MTRWRKKDAFLDLLPLAHRLLEHTRTGKNKLYSIHAPEVECIAKGIRFQRAWNRRNVSAAHTESGKPSWTEAIVAVVMKAKWKCTLLCGIKKVQAALR